MNKTRFIHLASGAATAVGAGLAQVPFSDSIAIATIQTNMITSLGEVFRIQISESTSKGMGTSMVVGTVGRAVAGALVSWIPVLGIYSTQGQQEY